MDPVRIDTYSSGEYQGYRLRPGKPIPFGATMVPGGANFSVYSSSATAVPWCCSTRALPSRGSRFPFLRTTHRRRVVDGSFWS